MSEGATQGKALADFAQAHGLAFAKTTELPDEGELLTKDGLEVRGAATGALADGEQGTLCYLHYAYRSNDATHSVDRTAAVIRVPESIGFAPYLGADAGATAADGHETKSVDLEGGGSVLADSGVDDAWLAELLSPAFTQWLQRNPDDFEWELCDGVLCVSRDSRLTKESELTALCADSAHIAATVREECLEEVDSGQAGRTAAKAKKLSGQDRLVELILSRTGFAHAPTDVASAAPQFHDLVVRHPSTYFISFWMTIAFMLGANIIGGGIFGLLLNIPNPGRAVLIFEILLFLIIGYFTLRSQINGMTRKLSSEGFWREYARTRDLKVEDPTSFAATHAKANLPGAATRVMSGHLGGVEGALMLTGDGLKRGDTIALVAGESGPVASAPLDVSAPGASAAALDSYVEKLAGELRKGSG